MPDPVLDTRPPLKAAGGAPPVSGGTLLVTRDGTLAVAADSERDQVSVVDIGAGALVATYALPHGAEPGRVVESGDGRVHVLQRGTGMLATITLGQSDVAQRALCAEPRGLGYSRAHDRVLVACRGGALLGLAGDEPAQLLATLPMDLRDVVVVPGMAATPEKLYVTRFLSAEVLELTLDFQLARTITPPARVTSPILPLGENDVPPPPLAGVGGASSTGEPVAFNPGVAWKATATTNGVLVTMQRTRQQPVDVSSDGSGYSATCGGLVAGSVMHVDRDGTIRTRDGFGAAANTDVAQSVSGWTAVIDAGSDLREVVDGFFEGNAFPVLLFNTLDEHPDGAFACDVPDTLLEPLDVQPTALAFNPTTEQQLVVQTREPAALYVYDDVLDGVPRAILLGGESVADTGHETFVRATGNGIACVSCHPEGEEDGRTWTFVGIGPRRTQSLIDMPDAPFHWQGDIADLAHLVDEVLVRRMGGAPQTPERIDALAEWLADLRPRAPLRAWDTLAAEGEQLFHSAEVGCAGCHTQATTDSFDVGTEMALQVPSLTGVGYRTPLMHDGCATTLHQRFDPACGGGDQHGVTSHLGPEQVDALVAYMQTL